MKKKFDLKLKLNKFEAEELTEKMAKNVQGGVLAGTYPEPTIPPGCDKLSGPKESDRCYSVVFCG